MSDINPTTRRQTPITAIFTAHPAQVNESYLGHMRVALGFCFWLLVAGGAALIHALIPALCETTASRIVQRLHARLSARHAQG